MRNGCSQVIVENFFEPCILFILGNGPSYGYELMEKLVARHACTVNAGNLYRCLARLHKQGAVKKQVVKGESGPNRTMYSLAPKGKELLDTWIVELTKQKDIISSLINNYQKKYGTR